MYHLFYKRKKLTKEQESEECLKCRVCCLYIALNGKVTTDLGIMDFQLMNTWGLVTLTNGKTPFFLIPQKCTKLGEKGCSVYETGKPIVCDKFKGGDADKCYIPFCRWYEPIPEDEKYAILQKGLTQEDV